VRPVSGKRRNPWGINYMTRFLAITKQYIKQYPASFLWGLMLLLASLGLLLAHWTLVPLPETAKHIFVAIVTVCIIELFHQLFVWKEFRNQTNEVTRELVSQISGFFSTSETLGLTWVYANRNDATQHILEAIATARRQVLILGVAFAEGLTIQRIVEALHHNPTISTDHKGEIDVRILALDPLCSPAVLRALLESDQRQVKEVIDSVERRSKVNVRDAGPHPYTDLQLYRDVKQTYLHLREFILKRPKHLRARFYRHYPSCWLFVVDDKAFYQPYTIRCKRQMIPDAPRPRLADQMPVFRFVEAMSSVPYNDLCDHFEQKWSTSTTDLFHMGNRLRDENLALNSLFKRRLPWIKSVLLSPGNKERRHEPRQQCGLKMDRKLVVEARDYKLKGEIVDYSANGLCLRLRGESSSLAAGAELTFTASAKKEDHVVTEVISHCVGPSENPIRYKVIRIDPVESEIVSHVADAPKLTQIIIRLRRLCQ
jgi:hypothetical protein